MVICPFWVFCMYRHLDSYKQYEPTYHNNHTGLLCDFLRQLCYRLSIDILQSLYWEYVYDPCLIICKKKCTEKKTLRKITVKQQRLLWITDTWIKNVKQLCSHLPITVTHLPTIRSVIGFRESVREKPLIWNIALKRNMVNPFY